MTDAEACAARMENLGVSEPLYRPLVALLANPLHGARVDRDPATGAIRVSLDLGAVDAVIRPIREWLSENGFAVPTETAH